MCLRQIRNIYYDIFAKQRANLIALDRQQTLPPTPAVKVVIRAHRRVLAAGKKK